MPTAEEAISYSSGKVAWLTADQRVVCVRNLTTGAVTKFTTETRGVICLIHLSEHCLFAQASGYCTAWELSTHRSHQIRLPSPHILEINASHDRAIIVIGRHSDRSTVLSWHFDSDNVRSAHIEGKPLFTSWGNGDNTESNILFVVQAEREVGSESYRFFRQRFAVTDHEINFLDTRILASDQKFDLDFTSFLQFPQFNQFICRYRTVVSQLLPVKISSDAIFINYSTKTEAFVVRIPVHKFEEETILQDNKGKMLTVDGTIYYPLSSWRYFRVNQILDEMDILFTDFYTQITMDYLGDGACFVAFGDNRLYGFVHTEGIKVWCTNRRITRHLRTRTDNGPVPLVGAIDSPLKFLMIFFLIPLDVSIVRENHLTKSTHCNTKDVNSTSAKNPEDASSLEFASKEACIIETDSDNDTTDSANAEDEITYPEGGRTAWLVVLGSWMSCFGSMGLMNCLGIFQTYLDQHQLQAHSSSSIAWIFGIYSFLAFFCGIEVGPFFDAKGPRPLILLGGIGTVSFLLLLEVCTKYWHFMLCFGLLGGISLSLAFSPSISIVAHYFYRRRGFAVGIASSGASIGGVVFPLLFQHVSSRLGFAWATRIIALVDLITFSLAFLLIPRRFPSKQATFERLVPDLSIFRQSDLMLATMGIFFMEWALFIPLTYLTSFALDINMSSESAYMLLSLVNAAAVFGRWIPGYCADRIGRFNALIITIAMCLVFIVCFWIPAQSECVREGNASAVAIAFAVLFGFASGSNVSLAPVCIGQLCKIERFGRYYATAYVIVSISTLTGIPICGAILQRCNGEYWGLITFAIVSYAASLICLAAAKISRCGWDQVLAVF
ncbi:monocarboxylate permease, putative [Talaromyces stipitatus ATCC 10500]|uniref:Monocarboxylate permease, putative n=1 Tax=Talaromyces stipitatus (strain ATCC 10500 / CBS 375.48 / QM 6759 / NRRL 1006) TaxID=441959 RepID=B8MA33_TALSN|nr:monocarboxylate permease, putative [Talaromyces stipitatus ATCC 10500]EED18362.1 monocarboxylate permease, putative [Talaromyces stipitatus ATCC 10500]